MDNICVLACSKVFAILPFLHYCDYCMPRNVCDSVSVADQENLGMTVSAIRFDPVFYRYFISFIFTKLYKSI